MNAPHATWTARQSDALRGRAQEAVDEVHDRVLVGVRHERQAGEDQHDQHELGDFECAAHRSVEDVAAHDVDDREQHHGEEDGGSGAAEDDVGAPLPAVGGTAH